jgi:capsular polysaccharide biosynthesis protein
MSVSGRTAPLDERSAAPGTGAESAEPPVDLTGVADALRRGRRLVAAIVVVVTGVALVVSLASPDRYRASARIAEDPSSAEPLDVAAADRRLATSRELVTAPAVLTAAAAQVPGESPDDLAAKVEAKLDITASILDVAATDGDPTQAAKIANAVATTFLAETDRVERDAVVGARERLSRELERQRRVGAADTTLEALRERISELAVNEVTAGSGLRLVQPAAVPAAPFAPRPIRSTVVAFLAALFCGVLVALARDRLRPQAPGARALAQITGLPLIAALPPDGSRGSRRAWPTDQALIEEAALQAAVRGALPARGQQIVVVHGAGHAHDAAHVAAGLVRSLNWAGQRAVLVELASPDDPPEPAVEPADDVPAIRCVDHADALDDVRRSDYRFVIVRSPEAEQGRRLRMLRDERAAVVLVARLGRTTSTEATAARRLIDALGLHALGLAVTCSAREAKAIAAAGFAAPLRLPARPRTARNNGSGPAVAERAPAAARSSR